MSLALFQVFHIPLEDRMTWNCVRTLCVVSSVAVLAVGCGQGTTSSSAFGPGSLVGPTSLTADDASVSSSADVSGTLAKGGNGNGNSNGGGNGQEKNNGNPEGETENGAQEQKPGSLSGFVTAVTANSITVRGVVVLVVPATVIRHGNRVLTIADIHVGDHVQVKGTSSPAAPTATATTLTATEIKVESMNGDDEGGNEEPPPPSESIVVGTVSALTGTCPLYTFTVTTATVPSTSKNVTTTIDTAFIGMLCETLPAVIKVTGVAQPDGSIVATKLEPGV